MLQLLCKFTRFAALIATLFVSLLAPARAVVDLDNDGVGDVWRLKYNAGELTPGGDEDGDGCTNAQESGAGTNPFSPSDVIAVQDMALAGDQLTLKWPSVPGKRYRVQSTTTITDANSWGDVTVVFTTVSKIRSKTWL